MLPVYETMEAIEEHLFRYEVRQATAQLPDLIDALASLAAGMSEAQLSRLNAILTSINEALANQDYVLMADILRFELRPLLQRTLS